MLNIFQQLVSAGKVSQSPLSAIRIKTHVPCQWACGFCHMEGSHFSLPVQNNKAFASALSLFQKRFNFTEVHYTGGEPTIHPYIVHLIRTAKTIGFRVKMTTNGQAELERYKECIRAGLEEVNISMHTLDGEELAKIMSPQKDVEWGRRAINRQRSTIASLKDVISVKINTCVGEDEYPAFSVASFASNEGIGWRPMNVLERSTESYAALRRLCDKMKARPVSALIVKGSSSFRIAMETPEGFKFKVKLIRPFRFPSMCSNCSLDAQGQCYEYAYGPRIEVDGRGIVVRNCVHRICEPCVLPVKKFFKHQLEEELHSALNE